MRLFACACAPGCALRPLTPAGDAPAGVSAAAGEARPRVDATASVGASITSASDPLSSPPLSSPVRSIDGAGCGFWAARCEVRVCLPGVGAGRGAGLGAWAGADRRGGCSSCISHPISYTHARHSSTCTSPTGNDATEFHLGLSTTHSSVVSIAMVQCTLSHRLSDCQTASPLQMHSSVAVNCRTSIGAVLPECTAPRRICRTCAYMM